MTINEQNKDITSFYSVVLLKEPRSKVAIHRHLTLFRTLNEARTWVKDCGFVRDMVRIEKVRVMAD